MVQQPGSGKGQSSSLGSDDQLIKAITFTLSASAGPCQEASDPARSNEPLRREVTKTPGRKQS
ncbi:hypothetical protein EYF80_062810 [Liparis tanakae]|uniref:Uncharacterized protein n=1 Tax=Liparis tanakae TaxID=230148 RepID=A0A4Z2EDT0_9TELE|nr:hypothetical protein EYF80_062810 [Liparis tanakae]